MPMHDIRPKARFKELGRVRLGLRSEERKGAPLDVTYFVLRDAPDVAAAYGKQPTELLVFLPFGDIESNLPSAYELYAGPHCLCRGDGLHILDRLDPKDNATRVIRGGQVVKPYVEDGGVVFLPGRSVPCPGIARDLYPRCAGCKPRTRLLFMVRDPERPQQLVRDRLGYYLLSTGSYWNYVNLSGSLQVFASLSEYMGKTLAGIPLILRRVPKQITYTGKNQDGAPERRTVTKALLDLEVDPLWAQVASRSMYEAALEAPKAALALPEGIQVVEPLDEDILDDGDDDVEPGAVAEQNGQAHDWNWFYGTGLGALGLTVKGAQELLGEGFHQRMTPDEAYAALKQHLLPSPAHPVQPGLFDDPT